MEKRQLPETSIEAFKSLNEINIRDIHKKIVYALSQIIEGTHEDISAFLKLDISVIWKRMNEVVKQGVVIRTNNKKPLRSGRNGFTYTLSQPIKTDNDMMTLKESLTKGDKQRNTGTNNNSTNIQQAKLF